MQTGNRMSHAADADVSARLRRLADYPRSRLFSPRLPSPSMVAPIASVNERELRVVVSVALVDERAAFSP